jgi:serine/threonine protein kinase
MIMEYATDGELYTIVRNFKPHTRKHDYVEKLSLIRQVCKAVECMHQNNIMHRDVKPENILLNMVNI